MGIVYGSSRSFTLMLHHCYPLLLSLSFFIFLTVLKFLLVYYYLEWKHSYTLFRLVFFWLYLHLEGIKHSKLPKSTLSLNLSTRSHDPPTPDRLVLRRVSSVLLSPLNLHSTRWSFETDLYGSGSVRTSKTERRESSE